MSLHYTDLVKESQMKGEDDSMTWQTYAVEKLVVLESVIQDMVQQKDDLPKTLLEVANAILNTLLGLNSLKNHKMNFERLLAEASTFLVIHWQLYVEAKVKYRSLGWPPPKLKDPLDKLVDTTYRIQKLMQRKSEKNLAKRVLLGCFGMRDLGKFNKYQRRLGIMALGLQVLTQLHRPVQSVPHVPLTTDYQKKPHNIDINAVLLAVVHSRAQPQDEDSDSEFGGEIVDGDLPDKKSAKKKAADKELTAEGSYLREVGVFKPANQRVKSEEDSERKSSKAKNEAKDDPKYERDEEGSAEDKPVRRIDRRTNYDEDARENQGRSKTMGYEPDEADLVEGTSAQGSRSNNAQSKTGKKPSQAYEDGKDIWDIAPKRKSRSRTNPVSPPPPPPPPGPPPMHQTTISDFSFINRSGTMINENVGNIYNLTTLK